MSRSRNFVHYLNTTKMLCSGFQACLVSVWALLILGLLPFKQRVNFPNGRLPLPNCSVFSCVYAAPDARIRRSVLGEMVWLFLPWLFREVFSDWQNGTFISHISLNCGTVCFMLRTRSSNLLLNRIALCSVVWRALSGGPAPLFVRSQRSIILICFPVAGRWDTVTAACYTAFSSEMRTYGEAVLPWLGTAHAQLNSQSS